MIPRACAQSTAFSYQGFLTDQGAPANGAYDFEFRVFDALTLGNQQGGTLVVDDLGVTNGLFTVTLDPGANVFTGPARWLNTAVRPGASSGAFTNVVPRQPVTAAPYAIYAGSVSAANITGTIPSANLGGTYTGAVTFSNVANVFTGNGAGLTNLNISTLGGLGAGNFWQLGGNNAGLGQFLGTTNNQPLELRANNQRGIRIQYVDDGFNQSVNFIGGYSGNFIAPGLVGATIGGGGALVSGSPATNLIGGNFGTIGGGSENVVSNISGTVGGGSQNVAGGQFATVAGGQENVAKSSSDTVGGGSANTSSGGASTVAGGGLNVASGNQAAVGGGSENIASGAGAVIGGGEANAATDLYAVIPGGYLNLAGGVYSFAAGQRAKALHTGTFVWSDSQPADFSSTASNQFLIRAGGGVGINTNNPQSALHVNGTITASNFSGSGAGLSNLNGSSIAPGSITGAMIANGSIGSAQIAAGAVGSNQLAAGAAAANLASGGYGGLPSTAIVVSDREINTNLLNAGFIRNGIAFTNGSDIALGSPSGPPATGTLSFERYKHSAVWLSNFNEMFIFGGYPNSQGLRYKPASNSWALITQSNAPYLGDKCVFGWTGSNLVVWSSGSGSGGRYNPSNNTWLSISTTNHPSADQSVAVWTGSRLIVWGGTLTPPLTNRTGAIYNPANNTWTVTSTNNSPTGRFAASAVWTGTEMVVAGGAYWYDDPFSYEWAEGSTFSPGGRYNPTTDTWSPIASAPQARRHATATWTGTKMLVMGGYASSNRAEQYVPSTDTWSLIASNAVLDGLLDHSAVWNGTNIYVWGSLNNSNGVRYNPASDTWAALPSTGVSPRQKSDAVWTGTDIIGWGGQFDYGETDDGRRYNLASNVWTAIAVPPATGEPGPRTDATAVWTGDRVVVWGGENSGTQLRTGGILVPGVGWTNTPTTGGPSPRVGHSAIWTGSEMIIWGGYDSPATTATGARYHVASNRWFAMNLTNAPQSRRNHSAVWTGTEMIIWGGYNTGPTNFLTPEFLNTGARYNPATDQWSSNGISNAFIDGRANHTAVWTGTEMIIWGGYKRTGTFTPVFTYYNNGGRYSVASNNFTFINNTPAGNARFDHSAVWTGTEMLIWGGETDAGTTNSGLRFNPSSNTWAALPVLYNGRSGHTAVWTGEHMILNGGFRNGTEQDGVLMFDPLADRWTSLSLGFAVTRAKHVAIWTGTNLLTGTGQVGGIPSDTWHAITPRQVYYYYQKQ